MRALRQRGLCVQPFKVGPDYIDPSHHTLAAGREGRNLDVFLCGEELIAPLFLHGSQGAETAIVEGVMGMFDGVSGTDGLGSTAEVARLLRAPVILVVDAGKMARSVAAIVHGCATFEQGVNIAGVILNRVGSDAHEQILREALSEVGPPAVAVLGALRRDERLVAQERHLGLVPAAEMREQALERLDALAAAISEQVDLDAVLKISRAAGRLEGEPWSPCGALGVTVAKAGSGALDAEGGAGEWSAKRASGRADEWPDERASGRANEWPDERASGRAGECGAASRGGRRARIAVAGGRAFSFHYRENLELLEAAGAELAELDPLRDERLPEGCNGLLLAGGFPEVYGDELSSNGLLRRQIARFAEEGHPVLAECGGLLYLAESLNGRRMCGVLAADGEMSDHLTIGYRHARAASATRWIARGQRARGHEFHRCVLNPSHDGEAAAWHLSSAMGSARGDWLEGFATRSIQASFLHVHWAAHPEIAFRFAEAAAEGGSLSGSLSGSRSRWGSSAPQGGAASRGSESSATAPRGIERRSRRV